MAGIRHATPVPRRADCAHWRRWPIRPAAKEREREAGLEMGRREEGELVKGILSHKFVFAPLPAIGVHWLSFPSIW